MGSGQSNNNAAVVGTIPKIAKAGHREDYIVRVLAPTKKRPVPRVELRVYVNNQTSSPPFQGLTSKGGYFMMDIKTFNAMVAMAPQVQEAYKAAMPPEGQVLPTAEVPEGPNLALLGGVATVSS